MSDPMSDQLISFSWDDAAMQLDEQMGNRVIRLPYAMVMNMGPRGQQYFKEKASLLLNGQAEFFADSTNQYRACLGIGHEFRHRHGFTIQQDPRSQFPILFPPMKNVTPELQRPASTIPTPEPIPHAEAQEDFSFQPPSGAPQYPEAPINSINQEPQTPASIISTPGPVPPTPVREGFGFQPLSGAPQYPEAPMNSINQEPQPPASTISTPGPVPPTPVEHNFSFQPPHEAPHYPVSPLNTNTAAPQTNSLPSPVVSRTLTEGSEAEDKPNGSVIRGWEVMTVPEGVFIDSSRYNDESDDSDEEEEIKRSPNCWILFRTYYQGEVMAEKDIRVNTKISTELSQRWRSMTPEEKGHWQDIAAELKAEHKRMHPDYKFVPRTKQEKKEKKRQRKAERNESGPPSKRQRIGAKRIPRPFEFINLTASNFQADKKPEPAKRVTRSRKAAAIDNPVDPTPGQVNAINSPVNQTAEQVDPVNQEGSGDLDPVYQLLSAINEEDHDMNTAQGSGPVSDTNEMDLDLDLDLDSEAMARSISQALLDMEGSQASGQTSAIDQGPENWEIEDFDFDQHMFQPESVNLASPGLNGDTIHQPQPQLSEQQNEEPIESSTEEFDMSDYINF
ncbi:hypothetical protein F4802DRAFT_602006 [Xylaria palmicola]|nr:hypothetical protein F4802DRAFT_602006 [Xylaria palmicola]